MKEFFLAFMIVIPLSYSIAFLVIMSEGIYDRNMANYERTCGAKMKRWEYIIPAHKLGCWLGE